MDDQWRDDFILFDDFCGSWELKVFNRKYQPVSILRANKTVKRYLRGCMAKPYLQLRGNYLWWNLDVIQLSDKNHLLLVYLQVLSDSGTARTPPLKWPEEQGETALRSTSLSTGNDNKLEKAWPVEEGLEQVSERGRCPPCRVSPVQSIPRTSYA